VEVSHAHCSLIHDQDAPIDNKLYVGLMLHQIEHDPDLVFEELALEWGFLALEEARERNNITHVLWGPYFPHLSMQVSLFRFLWTGHPSSLESCFPPSFFSWVTNFVGSKARPFFSTLRNDDKILSFSLSKTCPCKSDSFLGDGKYMDDDPSSHFLPLEDSLRGKRTSSDIGGL
jgi:hypothetical protein